MKTFIKIECGSLSEGHLFIWMSRLYQVISRADSDYYLRVKAIASFWTANPDNVWIANIQQDNDESFNGYCEVLQLKYNPELK
jgi:hypothetical protein